MTPGRSGLGRGVPLVAPAAVTPASDAGEAVLARLAAAAQARFRTSEEAAAAFQAQAITDLERERAALRQSVLTACVPAVRAVMAERGATVVVDARVAVCFDPAADITDAVLKRLAG